MTTSIPETFESCTTANTAEPFKARVQQAHALLRETYPALFAAEQPPPLKIGIHKDLLARHPDLNARVLRHALSWLCERPRYQYAVRKEGAVRLDLDGQPTGEVTAEQATIAKSKLTARKAKKSAKSTVPSTPAPTPVPTPPPSPPTPPSAISGRPVLRLKPKSAVVAVATVTRREVQP